MPKPYRAVMTTPAIGKRIMKLMLEDAKAALLYLGHRYPFEVGQALNAVTGKWSP